VAARRITTIPYRKPVRIFELDGFVVKRQKGDHLILAKAGVKRPLVIKTSPRNVPVTHMTALQKPPKHKGHEGTRSKSLHLQIFVYVVYACPRFVGVVFKDLFAVDSHILTNIRTASMSRERYFELLDSV
jgi:predicted RNA binding protein YcfA (HicA-like mRNA interferase family)